MPWTRPATTAVTEHRAAMTARNRSERRASGVYRLRAALGAPPPPPPPSADDADAAEVAGARATALGDPDAERWTHAASGADYIYPLSDLLDLRPRKYKGAAANDDDNIDRRLVMFRINAGSAVAPFLEFALVVDDNNGGGSVAWPPVVVGDKEGSGGDDGGDGDNGGGDDGGDDDDDGTEMVVHAATAAVHHLLAPRPVRGMRAPAEPRFCGALTAGGNNGGGVRREYLWFHVDPSPDGRGGGGGQRLIWATAHDLGRAGIVAGRPAPPHVAEDFSPELWLLREADTLVPAEIPLTLAPVDFRPRFSGGKEDDEDDGYDDDDDDDEEEEATHVVAAGMLAGGGGESDQLALAMETARENYTPAAAPMRRPHPFFGATMMAFRDPHWSAVLADVESGGADADADADADAAEQPPLYAVFLDRTVYLVGDCPRENAAVLAFAERRGSGGYSSAYLPLAGGGGDSFVWLVQSSRQMVALDQF